MRINPRFRHEDLFPIDPRNSYHSSPQGTAVSSSPSLAGARGKRWWLIIAALLLALGWQYYTITNLRTENEQLRNDGVTLRFRLHDLKNELQRQDVRLQIEKIRSEFFEERLRIEALARARSRHEILTQRQFEPEP